MDLGAFVMAIKTKGIVLAGLAIAGATITLLLAAVGVYYLLRTINIDISGYLQSATATSTASPSSTATWTGTPSPTDTLVPTYTASPTITFTPTPSRTPLPPPTNTRKPGGGGQNDCTPWHPGCPPPPTPQLWLSQSREEGVVRRVKAMEMCPENQRLA
jgi:hypothetical protein